VKITIFKRKNQYNTSESLKGFNILEDLTEYQKAFTSTFINYSKRFWGRTIEDIMKEYNIAYNEKKLDYAAAVMKKVLGLNKNGLFNEARKKAKIIFKTVRCDPGLKPIYAMSFNYFKYFDLIKEKWENSTLRTEISNMIFCVLQLPEKDAHQKSAIVESVFLHMPDKYYLSIFKEDWENVVKFIRNNKAKDLRGHMGKYVQPRDHGRNKKDKIPAPGGYMEKKRSFHLRTDYIEKALQDYKDNNSFYDLILENTLIKPEHKIKTFEISKLIRNAGIVIQLKEKYNYKCQICGKSIPIYKNDEINFYVEAHHIKQYNRIHEGPDETQNLIILCPNHHKEFDYGSITIDPKDTLTIIHKNENNPFHGKKIEKKHEIKEEYLKYNFNHFSF